MTDDIKMDTDSQNKTEIEMYEWKEIVKFSSDVIGNGEYVRNIHTVVMRVPGGLLYRTESVVFSVGEDGETTTNLAASESTVFVPDAVTQSNM